MTLGFAWIPVLALAKQKLSLSSLFSDQMVLLQNKIEVNYEIAGDNKVYLQAEAKMSGNKIVVSNHGWSKDHLLLRFCDFNLAKFLKES